MMMMMRVVLTGVLLILPLSVSGKNALSIKHPLSDEDISSALALGNDLTEKLPRLFLGAAGSDLGVALLEPRESPIFSVI